MFLAQTPQEEIQTAIQDAGKTVSNVAWVIIALVIVTLLVLSKSK